MSFKALNISSREIKVKLTVFWILLFLCGVNSAQETSTGELRQKITTLRSQKKQINKDTIYIGLLIDLGAKLRFLNPDSLLLLSSEAQKLSSNIEYSKGVGGALFNLGTYYSDIGEHTIAIDNYEMALVNAKKDNNYNLTIRIGNELANENVYSGNYSTALLGYLDNIKLAQAHDNRKMESILYENVADLYATQKDYEQALYFYNKVEKINNLMGDDINSAQTMSNVASIYAETGDFQNALFKLNRSINIFEKSESWDWLAFAYEVKGKVYLKQKQYTRALYWYDKSSALHENLQDDRGIIDLYNGMAEAHFGLEKDSISHNYALMAFEISSTIKSMEGIKKCSNTLYKVYKNQENYAAALKYHEIFRHISDTLSRDENKMSMTMLKTEISHKNQQEALVIKNEKALAKQRLYIYVAILFVIIMGAIAFLVIRGQKILKKLNKELESQKQDLEQREAELWETNNTKNKLFSIIAHDLRGPIGALEGLLKLLNSGDIKESEFKEFIPKLKNDVNSISFTLNNLLTWGQSQMREATTDPTNVDLNSLVENNINLLSELAFTKMITMDNLIVNKAIIWSDENQIDIVIRNLLSNALKFTPNNGHITIGYVDRHEFLEVFVKDTGIGIDESVQDQILLKNSNITTYGTNNEKGTGLGLSLCSEMVIKNGGNLWIKSELNMGSTFYFTVPKGKKHFQKSA
ncbi:tetratricopeptide repeat-containing sensor histidine kinase [Arenibacter sp. F26102]|uniref:tetratricopeptide repeat-containing sensor histidine kinase n=1 Tax=Arenibacter sp. F26102 TaxID=2926416 RepID=UPI001FF54B59|nr:tetratricopeptide repeat-containing sensor histidine kinase [Arenibacter sp. F26102]MCK0145501.1 tetratricopeptide repeat-containing sensor histidine kinase [Arenibacter sp. F26102]